MAVDARPHRLTLVCRAVAALVLAFFGGLAVVLPQSASGDQTYGLGDQIGFAGIGLLLAVGVLAFTRFRVQADETGIWVRNVGADRFFPWGVVVAIDVPAGSAWAMLELHDDETVALLALQTHDGQATIDSVLALRKLRQTATDSPP